MMHYIPKHNMTMQFAGFYISYNPVDVTAYGDVTTALVTDNMAHFLILNGNHVDEYEQCGPQGLEACMRYFAANAAAMNKHSDPLDAMVVVNSEGKCRYAKGEWGYVGDKYCFTLCE